MSGPLRGLILRWASLLALGSGLSGCQGVQSALSPQGRDADAISLLFWIMTSAGAAILIVVMAMALVAIYAGERWRAWMATDRIIIYGGLVFPIVTLTVLLAYGLHLMGVGWPAAEAEEEPQITVVGERWWWRVYYADAHGRRIESANEITIPAGRPVRIALRSADVIHSFWVPRLAGKLDMIPGRTNVITLKATEAGVSRGQCAEYCGGPHALMSFYVRALPEADFERWLQDAAAPSAPPASDRLRLGQQLFLENGCGACHTVRGTPANGSLGPDLTHVGSRMSLGAATLPNNAPAFARWIQDNQHIKPENLMPNYRIFTEDELTAVSLYLESLQ